MNSRFMNYPLSVKWTAFIPSVIGLVLFVSLVSLYGRFPAHQVREQRMTPNFKLPPLCTSAQQTTEEQTDHNE